MNALQDPESDAPHGRHKFIEYSPTVSSGVIIQCIIWLVSIGGAWGAYQADTAKRDLRLLQVEKDLEVSRGAVKESLTEIKGSVLKVQESLTEVRESLIAIKARNEGRDVSPSRK